MDGIHKAAKARLQGMAEKKAESTAPAYKKTTSPAKKAVSLNKKSMTRGIASENSFSQLERDLPKGGKAMKVAAEEGFANVEKKAAKKGLKRMVGAGLAGGAIGLGINALMEGLDAEETGSEAEDLDVVAKRQSEKTAAKIAKDKANSLQASTKKRVVKAPPANNVSKKVFKPRPRSDASIVRGFSQQLDKNFGPVEIEGMENVGKVMKDEFKKAATTSNKKPISKYLKR